MAAKGSHSLWFSWRSFIILLIALSCIGQWKLLNSQTESSDPHQISLSSTAFIPGDLPDALQPVTFHECCNGKQESFFSTCFTEKACNNSIYPFSSEREAAKFAYWRPQTRQELEQHNASCTTANAGLAPPTKWCQSNGAKFSAVLESFPMGCSWYTMEGGSGPFDRMILFPQGELAFCGIPKAGVTQWLQFLRFTMGSKDYQSYPHQKPDIDRFFVDRGTRALQEEVWQNWTKAVFIRNPAERLLSAYLDKIKKKPKQKKGKNTTFAEFVDYVTIRNESNPSSGLTWYTDPHWRPQAWSCGLSEFMPRFDYVGSLDRAAHHTKALLRKVHMWESFGKHYRVSHEPRKRRSNAAIPPPPLHSLLGDAPGFQQLEGGMDTYSHNKGSQKQIEDYYKPELMEKVRRAYWMDFALWDALQEAEKENDVSGRDIAKRLTPNCI